MTDTPDDIDRQAPVVGSSEIEIPAAPDAVWDAVTDFQSWPSWNPDVKSMSMPGPVAAGSVLKWRAGPGTITSTIQRVEPPHLIAWTGRTLGIRAIHFWWLEPRGAGTFVLTADADDGLVARVLRGQLQKTLDPALEDGLRHPKAEVERRTDEM